MYTHFLCDFMYVILVLRPVVFVWCYRNRIPSTAAISECLENTAVSSRCSHDSRLVGWSACAAQCAFCIRCTKIINADSEDPKYIINVKQFAKFVVDLSDQVAPTDIEEGMRVG